MKLKYVIGVDEAGRGPLAGPVAVGSVCVPMDFDWKLIPGVNDSKKLTHENRFMIFMRAKELEKSGSLQISVSMVSAKVIDRIGIVSAINLAIKRSLSNLTKHPYHTINRMIGMFGEVVEVRLDGGLQAPKNFVHQETIIKGDSKEKVIGLASIMAKVTRDRYMVRISAKPKFAPYTLSAHKGYGTKTHREAIAQHGLSSEHRKSYCKNIKVL